MRVADCCRVLCAIKLILVCCLFHFVIILITGENETPMNGRTHEMSESVYIMMYRLIFVQDSM